MNLGCNLQRSLLFSDTIKVTVIVTMQVFKEFSWFAPTGDEMLIRETLPVSRLSGDFTKSYKIRKTFRYKPHIGLREYKPFIDYPDLHLEVASQNIADAYVNRFVRKYGLLLKSSDGCEVAKGRNKPEAESKGEKIPYIYVDVYWDYKKYLKDIKNVAWLLGQLGDSWLVLNKDSIRAGGKTQRQKSSEIDCENMPLESRVIWHKDSCVIFLPSRLAEAIEYSKFGIEKGSLHQLFSYYIASKANQYLSKYTSMRIERNEIVDEFQQSFMPKNLLGAIWIMIHNDFFGGLQTIKCCHCKVTFSIREKSRGKARKYCSDACKMANYRARKSSK